MEGDTTESSKNAEFTEDNNCDKIKNNPYMACNGMAWK
jgi:hypothetical protein